MVVCCRGYTPAARWVAQLNRSSVFVKAATNPLTAQSLRREFAVYERRHLCLGGGVQGLFGVPFGGLYCLPRGAWAEPGANGRLPNDQIT